VSAPNYRCAVLMHGNSSWHDVGVAWLNNKGQINIRLNPLIDLGRMGPKDKLYLFPKDVPSTKDPGSEYAPEGEEYVRDRNPDDDDIPF
jgi:hypothetical protein